MTNKENYELESLLNEALSFAKLGFKVFPLIPKQKRPIKNWNYLKATNDPEEVFNIFCSEKPYNLAINLKEADLIVLDLDRHTDKQDGVAWLANKTNESLANDCVISTPRRGIHVVYRLNGFDVPNKLELADGVEILTDFCTLPPSYIDMPKDNIKGSYKLVSGSFEDIQAIPSWLMNEIKGKQGKTTVTLNYSNTVRNTKRYTGTFIEEIVQGVEESSRNVWLTKYIGKLLALGTNPESAYQFILVINENFVSPPVSDRELNSIFKSVMKREVKKKGVIS